MAAFPSTIKTILEPNGSNAPLWEQQLVSTICTTDPILKAALEDGSYMQFDLSNIEAVARGLGQRLLVHLDEAGQLKRLLRAEEEYYKGRIQATVTVFASLHPAIQIIVQAKKEWAKADKAKDFLEMLKIVRNTIVKPKARERYDENKAAIIEMIGATYNHKETGLLLVRYENLVYFSHIIAPPGPEGEELRVCGERRAPPQLSHLDERKLVTSVLDSLPADHSTRMKFNRKMQLNGEIRFLDVILDIESRATTSD